jgi:hypothetical protein
LEHGRGPAVGARVPLGFLFYYTGFRRESTPALGQEPDAVVDGLKKPCARARFKKSWL